MNMNHEASEKQSDSRKISDSALLKPPIFVFFLAASLVGIFATAFLSYRHILLAVEEGAISESPLCRASATINCDAVLQSSAALIFGYFPTAVVGLCGFTVLFWLSINGLLVSRLRKAAFQGIMIYLCIAISFSAYFSYLLFFKEDFLCTWCIVVHVVNSVALSFGLVVAFRNKASLARPSSATKAEELYVITVAILAAAIVMSSAQWTETSLALNKVTQRYNELRENPDVVTAIILASPSYDITIDRADPVYGSPEAPYAIVLFTDLQCPVCLSKELFLHAMVDINREFLRLVIKNFPLCTDCNKKISRNLHPYACEAASAAYAAFLLGGTDQYWNYLELIFSQQSNLKTKPWLLFASQLGLRESEFVNYMKADSPVHKKIQEDIKLGLDLGLESTPAIFFLGKKIPEDLTGLPFMIVIENLLRAQYPEKMDLNLRK